MFAQRLLQLLAIVVLFIVLRWILRKVFSKALTEEEESNLQKLLKKLREDKEKLLELKEETETTEAVTIIEKQIKAAERKLTNAQNKRAK